MATAAALMGFLAVIRAEQEKRAQRARMQGRARERSREELYQWLDLMAARRRAAPGYVEPSPAQRAGAQRLCALSHRRRCPCRLEGPLSGRLLSGNLPRRASGIGASRPLRRIPAIVSFLNPQPASCMQPGGLLS